MIYIIHVDTHETAAPSESTDPFSKIKNAKNLEISQQTSKLKEIKILKL